MAEPLKIKIHEIEPGWLVLHFDGHKPFTHQRYHFLDKSLHDWLADHPGRVLVQVMPIEFNGQLMGLNAWHGDMAGTKTMQLKVGKTLVHEHGREYLEALLAEIGAFLQSQPYPAQMLAIVNRRGIVTIVDASREQGMMMTLERFDAGIDPNLRELIRQFFEDQPASLFPIPLMPQFKPPSIDD